MIKFPNRRQNASVIPATGLKQMLDRAPAGSQTVAAALARLDDAYARTLAAHERTMGDATVTPAARTVRSAKTARATLGPAFAAVEAALGTAAEGRESLARRAAMPFDFSSNFPATMVAAEIRSHFASLPSGERLAALNEALTSGDEVTMKAVGAAPAYLTGLPPAVHAHARDAFIDLHPDAKAARDMARNLEEQQSFAVLFVGTVAQSTADLIDFVAADSFEAAAQEAVAA